MYLQIKYANIVGSQLVKFSIKQTNPYIINFRCPFCGDSQKNKFKARGYLIERKQHLHYKCHNCDIYYSFAQFLKHINKPLYDDYIKELFLDKNNQLNVVLKQPKIEQVRIFPKDIFSSVKKISQLNSNHPAKQYVLSRKIPNIYHRLLRYTPKFYSFVNSIIPDKFDLKKVKEQPRLLIPLIATDNTVIGFQGRSFDKNDNCKYITIVINKDYPKVFGLNYVDMSKTFYAVEGPIDSMFVENSIAFLGSDYKVINKIEKFNKEKCVIIFDNQPRNSDVVKKINNAIDDGFNVVIWPASMKQKDINEFVIDNDIDYIKHIIDNNIFNGLAAKTKLSEWRKC